MYENQPILTYIHIFKHKINVCIIITNIIEIGCEVNINIVLNHIEENNKILISSESSLLKIKALEVLENIFILFEVFIIKINF
jgi:hypothetical protein